VNKIEKRYLIFQGVVFGVLNVGVTYLAISKYLPNCIDYTILLALLNGGIIAMPVIAHYWILKM
jgi:hypothetical protein